MPSFNVTLQHDVTSTHSVEAPTASDAVNEAIESAPGTLCHHCSGRYDIGDVFRAVVCDPDDNELLVDHLGGITPPEWTPIDQADKSAVLLVNDTTGFSAAPWVAAKWIEGVEWSGWAYEDDILTDGNPEGPKPTHFFPVPTVPGT